LGKRGFTLVEIIVVLVIIGIGMSLFYSVLFMNWTSLEKQTCLVDLQMEADNIINMISSDGRGSRQILVNPDGKGVTFNYPTWAPAPTIVYSLTPQGQITKDGNVISSNIDFNNSNFSKSLSALVINLLLQDTVFGRRVTLPVSTQVYPRNLL
jgi:prepilin-type N-terminal cleavage/methylation domain-containing protein